MSSVAYTVQSAAAIALTANTPRTCVMVITPSNHGISLVEFGISFDGVTASAVPVIWEIVKSTNASNSTPGTGNTNENSNIQQIRGRAITLTGSFTAFSASTSEPTVLTVLRRRLLTPAGGTLDYDFPLGMEIENSESTGLGIRLTSPTGAPAVNVRVGVDFERL
jgi:hypothetical protein